MKLRGKPVTLVDRPDAQGTVGPNVTADAS